GATDDEVFSAFLLQFYLAGNKTIPKQIIIPLKLIEQEQIANVLSEEAKKRIQFYFGIRDEKRKYLELAGKNAENALNTQQNQQRSLHARFIDLEQLIEVETPLKRLECFDISHTSGQQTVASCVVFDRDGPKKSDYRRFNIEGITPGDDYAAMAQALKRRYKTSSTDVKLPDLLLIDGGKGQLGQAELHFNDWPEERKPIILGVAKGTSRKPGLETLIFAYSHQQIPVSSDQPGLHLIQHIRDESHRFAITGHRARRQKAKTTSPLEEIPGIGAKKRQALLKYMGGLRGLKKASREEIAKVPGISESLAEAIFDNLHP
ncbi:MAG: excinuclease ABC subunit UvrC, partial [Pseudomonadota bacterium]